MKIFLRKAALSLLACTFFYGEARAEFADDNPAGVAGQFNGNVTTGGSYDPYTGNATRSITDLAVTGSVGAYPLAFTRTMNSRSTIDVNSQPLELGEAGMWRHNYQWKIQPLVITHDDPDAVVLPETYTVYYPDGRRVSFSASHDGDPYFRAGAGVADRFKQLTSQDETECSLLLPDGGRIVFDVAISYQTRGEPIPYPAPTYTTTFTYTFRKIVDPHGLVTMISYPGETSDGSVAVVEPAGRCLKLFSSSVAYNGVTHSLVTRVEERENIDAPARRSVEYHYAQYGNSSYAALDNVVYYGDTTLTARYTYQNSNAGSGYLPLLKTCDDPMYGGAMNRIAYVFASTPPSHGFLLSENYFDGVNVGVAVSTLSSNGNTRTETRGDGPARTFTYADGYLQSWTDFKGALASQSHPNGTMGFVSSYTDPRGAGFTTDFQRDPWTGNIRLTTFPQTPSDSTRSTMQPTYSGQAGCEDGNNQDSANPYFPCSVTDERQKTTKFTRDPVTKRVTRIDYPDAAFEEFVYNGFGQVTRHRRKNGAYEHAQYDERGLLKIAWNPLASRPLQPDPGGPELKTRFVYYTAPHPWQDRLQTVIDPRGNATDYEYDLLNGAPYAGRGLVTKIIHPLTALETVRKYVSFDYDSRGNKLWQENELRERTSYGYDDYNRVLNATTPLPNNGTATSRYTYAPTNGGSNSPLSHTANAPDTVTTPTGIITTNVYDPNLRLKTSTVAEANVEKAAKTEFFYDEVGNPISIKDPRENVTATQYDQRNRKKKVTSPAPVNYVTEWFYDPAGNVRLVKQPDSTPENPREQVKTYDSMNRLETDKDPMGRITTYTYWASGQVKSVRDPEQRLTQFEYDERDLKSKMTYPNNSVVEGWEYDAVGNLAGRPTVGGPKQLFTYDARNRTSQMRWTNAIDSSDFGYDAASRLISARNPYSTITRQYDVGGRLTLDRQVFPAVSGPAAPPLAVLSAVSRKSHGSAGVFDLDLPLTGYAGIECRSGGGPNDYQIVVTFANAVTFSGATVTSGAGSVASTSSAGSAVTVNLTGVNNAQLLTVKLSSVNDGVYTADLTVPMQVLVADTSANGVVNSGDMTQARSRLGQTASSANFRSDVNADGVISQSDVDLVRSKSGTGLPVGAQGDVSYAYDNDGRVKRLSVPGTTYDFDYRYDALGRFEKIIYNLDTQSPPGVYYQYSYDRASNVIARQNFLNATALSYEPDEINRVKELRVQLPGATFSTERYGYDAMSRLRSIDRDEEGKRDAFGYNPAGELTSVDYRLQPDGQGGFTNPARTVGYGLDNAGNRLSVNENGPSGPSVAYTPNNLNQYETAANNPAVHGPQHELTDYQGVNYRYLADTRLAEVTSADGTYQLGYDALGRTVKRTLNGQTTFSVYSGASAILEFSPGGTVTTTSLYGLGVDEIIARNNNGESQFLMQDRLGNTVAVTGGQGQLLESYRYDAFGAATIKAPNGTTLSQSAINNRFLFTGREWVQRFGFYEYRARAYHPGLGRFMSEDPLGFAAGDTNLYRYCAGDPVNRTDPSGLAPQSHPPPQLRDTSLGRNPFEAFPQGQGISTAGWWGGKPGGNDFYSGFVGRSGGSDGGGTSGSAPSGRNADGTPILRAQPVSNTIGVMGVNGTNAPGNQALIQFLRGVGTVVYRDYLSTVVQGLANSGYNSATLLGYSRGGVVAINQMGAFSSFTFNFVGIDVVRFGRGDLGLPSNVVSATNFYQQNPHSYLDLSGNPFIGTRLTSDTIDVNNNNWTGGPYSDVTHNNIVERVFNRNSAQPGGG